PFGAPSPAGRGGRSRLLRLRRRPSPAPSGHPLPRGEGEDPGFSGSPAGPPPPPRGPPFHGASWRDGASPAPPRFRRRPSAAPSRAGRGGRSRLLPLFSGSATGPLPPLRGTLFRGERGKIQASPASPPALSRPFGAPSSRGVGGRSRLQTNPISPIPTSAPA